MELLRISHRKFPMGHVMALLMPLLPVLLAQGVENNPAVFFRQAGCNEMNGFCSCVQEYSLQCIDMGITNLNFLRENLQNDSIAFVSLSFNNISQVLNGDLPFYLFTELVVLHLDHNAISEIEPQAFEDLHSLRNINLSFNKLTNIHIDTFKNNSKLRELGLSYNLLTDIEFVRRVPSLQYLFLDNNQISVLSNKTFCNTQSSDLYLINLRNNSMLTIEPKAFYGLTKLQFLLLEGNLLTVVHPGTFRFTPILKFLHMDRNNLTDLSLSHNTINLREGFFSQNNISILTNDIFSGSTIVQLEELNLEKNSITIIRHRAFQRLQRLWKLNLSSNNISFIYPDTFQNATTLSILDLSNNQIESIEFVRNIPNLEYLLMPYNNVQVLENETFCSIMNSSELFRINLSNNNITTIEPQAFQCLQDLEFLDLSFNNIAFLYSDQFQNVTELIELNLNNNHIYQLNVIQNIPNLEVLSLSNNNIPILFNNTFSSTNSSRLQRIYLAKNNLTQVEPLAFAGIQELQALDLSGNNISTIHPNTIPYIKNYYVV